MSVVDLSYRVAQRLVLILIHDPPEPGSVQLISLCLMLRMLSWPKGVSSPAVFSNSSRIGAILIFLDCCTFSFRNNGV